MPDENWEYVHTKLRNIGNKAIKYTRNYFTLVNVYLRDQLQTGNGISAVYHHTLI